MNNCIFCKIINKQIPAKIEHENEDLIVIHDINPKSKTHLLIIPKTHINTIADSTDDHQNLHGKIILTARDLGKKLNLEGYRLQYNVGQKGGQEVFHIHLHLLG